MRTKKPWVRARRVLEGWYVRFIFRFLIDSMAPAGNGPTVALSISYLRVARHYRKFSAARQYRGLGATRHGVLVAVHIEFVDKCLIIYNSGGQDS